jgi:hypothetical protein
MRESVLDPMQRHAADRMAEGRIAAVEQGTAL